jgi:hypothetical protein
MLLELYCLDPQEGHADAVVHARYWSTARVVALARKAIAVERTCWRSTTAMLSY